MFYLKKIKIMTALVAQKEIKMFDQTKNNILEVIITPCNEGHSMTYCENFMGTIKEILLRSQEILIGLKKIFSQGDFSIKIEDTECKQIRFVHSGFIFDNYGKIVGNLNDYILT
ncbi:MAG: hypothetical protein EAZ97_05640 [Bacteroidetes bacterium]|nr:MAG: hypothetical protein EAZ97_05640 [Bacteroidota bacterium]